MLIFDIETGPMPIEKLQQIVKPFDVESMPHPGEFDPASVKTGNLKDEAKIQQKIDAAREAHEKRVADYATDLDQAEAKYWAEIQDKAALSATRGEVVAIGYRNDKGEVLIDSVLKHSEEDMLRRFWDRFAACRKNDRSLVGFNIKGFDVPFLARRSWAYGIRLPPGLTTPTGYLSSVFVDLMEIYQCGNRRDYVSCDELCRAYGLQGKPDDCTGAQFSQMLLSGDQKQVDAAVNYLIGDLEMNWQLCQAMGVS